MKDSWIWMLALLLGCSSPAPADDDDDDSQSDDDDGGGSWASSAIDPQPMAFHFGSTAGMTAEDFADETIVVLGEGPDATFAGDLQAAGKEVFGWVDAGAPRAPSEIDGLIGGFGSMGLDGVVLANVGLDVVGNNQGRPILFANTARGAGLKVMQSATDPADVVHEIDGFGQSLQAGDRVLLSGFGYGGGSYQDAATWRAQVDAAIAGAALWDATVVATTHGGDAAAGEYAWWCAWLDGLEAVAWSSEDFGTAQELTFPGPSDGGNAFAGAVTEAGGGSWSRDTDTGTVIVDTTSHTGAFQ